jgi:nicotinate-nucleotide pyrophosphorylase (carboxylating)
MFTFHPLSEPTRAVLSAGGLDPDHVAALVRMTVSEDLAGGIDVTSFATVPAGQRSVGVYGARAAGTIAGLAVAASVVEAVCGDDASAFDYHVRDGERVKAGAALATVTAPTRLLLTAERSSLNLLCHMSGVATATARWVDALAGTGAAVRDTRKTIPGLRAVEKYAVRCGGGVNHRMSLSDAALVKDNHVVAAGGIRPAFEAVRRMGGELAVEIEVDGLDQLRDALDAGADVVMFDNFTPEEMREGVAITREFERRHGRRVVVEASGGLTIEVAGVVGATGVDYVSVGALTHSAPALDIGLDVTAISAS